MCELCSIDWTSSWQKIVLRYTATMSVSQCPGLQMVGGWKGVRKSATIRFPCFFAPPQALAPAEDTILSWEVMTFLSSCSLSEVHRPLLFSLSHPFHMHTYSSRQLQMLPCSRLLLASGAEVSPSQVLLRTLHTVSVSDSGFCCFSDD